jgi:GTP-binding protein EngB required for normal cell division
MEEQNHRVPGAFIDYVEDTAWFDYAEAQHAIWASMTDYPRNDSYDADVDSDSQLESISERFSPSGQSSPEQNVVIAVMGVTGTGKSTFIKTISGRNDVVVGDDLSSGSSKSPPRCQVISIPTD